MEQVSTDRTAVRGERPADAGEAKAVRPRWARLFKFRATVPLPFAVGAGALAWLAFLSGWHLLAASEATPEKLLPGPSQVVGALWRLLSDAGFGMDVLQSVKRILISFAIAVAIALPLGMLMGAYPAVESFFQPLVSPFRYLPAPSFVPLLLMWLGSGDGQKIALLVLGVVWFLVSLFMDNTKAVQQELVECSLTLGAGRRGVFWNVLFPAALPGYVDTVGPGSRTPVGSYPPNALGLHDLAGNVCEWTADSWSAFGDRSGSDDRRVIRGGAWDHLPRLLRISWRDWAPSDARHDNLGFRVAADLPDKSTWN